MSILLSVIVVGVVPESDYYAQHLIRFDLIC